MKSIYEYEDYRLFLKEKVEHFKSSNPKFSYRYFSKKSGLKSPSYLKLIISGKRSNIGKRVIFSISKGFGLTEAEAKYFEGLVYYNQATTAEEKNHYYVRLLSLLPVKNAKVMEERHYRLFSNWYYAAICELVRLKNFKEDYFWISKRLRPSIQEYLVKQALEDLQNIGLLERGGDGRLHRTDHMLATSSRVKSKALIQFNEKLSAMSLNALKKDPAAQKEYSSITIAVPTSKISKIKEKMGSFRRELHSYLENVREDKDDVVHISLQLFSLTHGGAL